MDLALAFGDPRLGQHMTEREFARWNAYIQSKGLPMRRIELYLAQIAKFVVQTMGGIPDAETADFLFDRREEPESVNAEDEDGEADELADAIELFDFKPVNAKR